jgi:tRNA (guanine-N7-)-methyltransferase
MRLRNIPGADEIVANSPFCIQNSASNRGQWKELLGNAPIHMEIGMGKGQFLMTLAKLHPEIQYIGVERYTSVLLRAVQKMDVLALPNVHFLCEDAAALPEIFAPGEVDRIYLNFSDPWPKDRHARRRLTSHQFLERYDQFLAPDGRLEFKTDNQDLFTFSLEEIENDPRWHLDAFTRDLHHDAVLNEGNIMTEYEEKFSALGHPICKLIASR